MNAITDHVSFSSLSRYRKCPASFRAYYSEPHTIPTAAMVSGQENHRAIAKALAANDISKAPLGPRLRALVTNVLKLPVQMIEKSFEIDIVTTKLSGAIDAASVHGNTGIIVDWKSSAGAASTDSFQLRLYTLSLFRTFPALKNIRGYFAYLGSDHFDTYDFIREDAEIIHTELTDLVDEILCDDTYPERPGPHCQNCQNAESCKIVKEYRLTKINTPEQAIELAQRTFALENVVEKARTLIKDYLLVNGLDSLAFDDTKVYLSTAVSLRSGKIRTSKEKKAAENIAAVTQSQESAKESTAA